MIQRVREKQRMFRKSGKTGSRTRMLVILPVRICSWADWCSLLKLSRGVLRQVSHHRLFIDVWICHFIGLDKLTNTQPIVGQAHGFCCVLKCILRIPSCPIGTQSWSNIINQSTNCFTIIPIYKKSTSE